MIEEILEQVRKAVSRFVARNPLLRHERDDLVQEVFVKILPRMGGGDFSLSQCRSFAHQATFWTCQTALRSLSKKKSKNCVLSLGESVQYLEGSCGLSHMDWDRVEAIVDSNDALFTWYSIEPDGEIRDDLHKQIMSKFDYLP